MPASAAPIVKAGLELVAEAEGAEVQAAEKPSRPLVSVVIICHNYGEFVATAIKSALAQDYHALDIVVVDDGSTDQSREIIEGFGDNIRYLFKERGGHVSAFNEGFFASRGDIVIFLDADDLIYPHYVSTVVTEWEHPLTKIQCRLDTIDRDGIDQRMPFPYFAADLTPEAVLQSALRHGIYPWTVSTGNAFARTFLASLLPIETDLPVSPDGYVNKLAPLYGPVKSVNMVLGAYRVHGHNTWAQTSGALQLKAMTRGAWLDAWNHRQFEAHARRTGHEVAAYDDIREPHLLERRLISLRLAPQDHPLAGDTVPGLARRGISSAREAPSLSGAGRVLWACWFLVLAFFPKPIVRQVIRLGRAQMERTGLARRLVGLSRGAANPGSVKIANR